MFEKNNRLETVTETLMEALDPLCRIVLLLCGALGVAKGALNAGALVVMFGYFYEYNELISDLKYMVTQLPVLRNLEERISVFYRDQESAEKEELTVLPEEVEIENLHFSYENTSGEVLRGLNIHIPLTGKIILFGKNGSGKSTLMRLILGLYPGYTGKIWLGTQELREIQPESWRKQCAYVEQNPFLLTEQSGKISLWELLLPQKKR
ncbi:MAG: ATP-binding cassette domain-containing protein [Blautia sp.]